MNTYGTAIEVTTAIVHRATKFVGTTDFVVFPNCHNTVIVHSFQEGTDRKTTCRYCQLKDENR